MNRGLNVLLLVGVSLLMLGFEWEGRLGRLERQLENGDARQRREVVRLMGSYPASEVRGPLLRALEDEDPAVRSEAAETAGRVRLTDAVPTLLEWLEDEDADVRSSAARALGRIGDARATGGLVRALGDASPHVRREAVVALGEQGGADVVVPLLGRLDDDDADIRVQAAHVLATLGDPRAVVPLVGRARDEAPTVRQAVYSALGALGDRRSSAALIQSLRDESEPARLAAIAALGRLGAPRGVEPLVELLHDRDPRTPRAAVSALAAIATPQALEAVVDALGIGALRDTAASLLSAHSSDSITPLLARALRTSRDPAQSAAIGRVLERRLQDGAQPDIAPVIAEAIDSGRAGAEILLPALARSGDPEVLVGLLEHLDGTDLERRAALGALTLYFELHPADGRAADPLLAVLGDVPPADRVRVVQLLGQVGASRALPVIRALLEHEDTALQLAAVQAIGAIGDPIGADALLELIDSPDGQLRFEAARALGEASNPEVIDELITRVLGRRPVDRHALLLALGGALSRTESIDQARAEAVRDALLRILRGRDRMLGARVVDAVSAWDHPLAAPVLAAAAPHHPSAFLAIRDLGLLRETLERGNVPSQVAALAGLGRRGDASDIPRIVQAAQTGRWPLPAAAAFALAEMTRREVPTGPEVLCPLLGRRDAHVRANIMVALARTGASCPERDPSAFLDASHAAVVRGAAARWLAATQPGSATQDTLRTCAEEDLAPEVSRACGQPGLPTATQSADVYAYAFDRESLMRRQLIALRFADGSSLLVHTDANAHVQWPGAPAGRVMLGDPLRTPLQP